jgi:surface antigen
MSCAFRVGLCRAIPVLAAAGLLAIAISSIPLQAEGLRVPLRQTAERNVLATPHFEASDELATLEALHLALTEVGDGASYVWHRRNGRLSGVIQPTSSFVDRVGRVCRHLIVVLSAGAYSKRTEGIACRLATGVWQLEG